MYVKEIEYENYAGEKLREKFYFNLTETELSKMQLTTDGGLGDRLIYIVNTKDISEMTKFFDRLIFESYGEISADKKRFIKSKELSEAFMQTEAYNKLFMSFINDSSAAAEFVNGILPKDLADKVPSQSNLMESITKDGFISLPENGIIEK